MSRTLHHRHQLASSVQLYETRIIAILTLWKFLIYVLHLYTIHIKVGTVLVYKRLWTFLVRIIVAPHVVSVDENVGNGPLSSFL